MLACSLTLWAKTTQLQQMVRDGEPGLTAHTIDQFAQAFAGELDDAVAPLADQVVAIAAAAGIGVAVPGAVHAADNVHLAKQLQCTVDCNQAERRIDLSAELVDLVGAQSFVVLGENLEHREPGLGDAIALLTQGIAQSIDIGRHHGYLIENLFQ